MKVTKENQARGYIASNSAQTSSAHPDEPDPAGIDLLKGEQGYIDAWRKARYGGETEETTGNLAGLALSGGGIRSATFSLGVMQALAHRDLLKRFDYLSTVSGGGYIGSAITWLVSDYASDRDRAHRGEEQTGQGPRFGLGKEDFPFGSDDPAPDVERSARPDQNSMLSFLRQHGNYLAPGAGISLFSLLGVVLRGMLLNLLVWIPVFILFFRALFWLPDLLGGLVRGQHFPISQLISQVTSKASPIGENLFIFNAALWFVAGLVALLLLITWLYSFATWIRKGVNRTSQLGWYGLRRGTEKLVAVVFPLSILLLVIGTLPVVATALLDWMQVGPAAILTGVAVLLRGFLKSFKEGISLPTGFVVSLAAVLFLYGVVLVSFQIAYLHYPFGLDVPSGVASLALAAFAFVTGWLVNLNYISIHRFYRDRLMETFMPDISDALGNRTTAAGDADSASLQDLGNKDRPRGPYHIVNTNAVLVNSKVSKYKDRGGDNFILSPLYCGSNATGWIPTENFMKGKTTLATAVAISGAAANPNTGVGGEGLTRNLFLSLVMSLLNIKLGYWASNPMKHPFNMPNHFRPGAYSLGNALGIGGLGFNENRSFVQLSDGGHFENTAIYELVRRGMKLIVCCDGGADPDFSFSDLQTTVRRIEDDFGARLEVIDTASPDQTVPREVSDMNYPKGAKFAKQGHLMANIKYADGSTGTIIYLKTTLMEGVSFKVKGYAAQNPDFPDQSTADQFFDEVQFEAYRELGYRIAHNMLDSPIPVGSNTGSTGQNLEVVFKDI